MDCSIQLGTECCLSYQHMTCQLHKLHSYFASTDLCKTHQGMSEVLSVLTLDTCDQGDSLNMSHLQMVRIHLWEKQILEQSDKKESV